MHRLLFSRVSFGSEQVKRMIGGHVLWEIIFLVIIQGHDKKTVLREAKIFLSGTT